MRTTRQRRGAEGEALASAHVLELGWQLVGRNVKVGRDEIDILAIDPGPPETLVFIEVRSLRTSAFGSPEERVDRLKVARLYRSMASFAAAGAWRPRRVDLVIVDRRKPRVEIRHFRALEPP
jgi:putative endonuclease